MTLLLAATPASQGPRVSLRPTGRANSSGADAVYLASQCGIDCDLWQADDLDGSMAERADGSWAATEVCLICSRQNGKNVEIEVRELYGLVVRGEWIIHTAHLFPTARESFFRLLSLIEANPDIKNELVYKVASPMSGFEMRFRSGGRIRFIARSRTSGRGLTGDMLVFDEVQDLNDDAHGALLPVISARPGAQVWYTGSAPGPNSTVLHRLRTRGRSGVVGPFWYAEYSARPDADLDDRDAWQQGNPGRGIRITDSAIEGERRSMSDEMFARERLSISPDLLEAGGPFGTSWLAVCDPEATAKPGTFAIDINPERSAAAIVACGPGPVLSVVDYRPGTNWLVGRCAELRDKYKIRFAVDKTGPAASFLTELARRRVKLVELDGTDMVRAAGHIFDRVHDRSVIVRTNDDLDRAVSGAVKRPVGDAFAWGRKNSASDICLLVAATAALWGQEQKTKARLVNMADLMCKSCGAVLGDCDHEQAEV